MQCRQPQRQRSKFPGLGALDLRPSCREIRSVKSRGPPRLVLKPYQVDLFPNRDKVGQIYSPLGPVSSSARKPSGPTAMLVGIPKEMCRWEDLSNFLDFLSNRRSIWVQDQRGDKDGGPQRQTPRSSLALSISAIVDRSFRHLTHVHILRSPVCRSFSTVAIQFLNHVSCRANRTLVINVCAGNADTAMSKQGSESSWVRFVPITPETTH